MGNIVENAVGKMVGAVAERAVGLTKDLIDKKIKNPKLVRDVKTALQAQFGDCSFYNDIDAYITRNNIIEVLIDEFMTASSSPAITSETFTDHHFRQFVDMYPRYKSEFSLFTKIRSFFSEAYGTVYSCRIIFSPGSEQARLQKDLHIQTERIIQNQERGGEVIINKLDHLSQQIAEMQTSIASTGKDDLGECSEAVLEYQSKIDATVKSTPPVEYSAIAKYTELLADMLSELRDEPRSQVDKMGCRLHSNIALCYSNCDKPDEAFKQLKRIDPASAEESKVYHFVFAAVIINHSIENRYGEAIAHLERALSIDLKYHRAFLLLQYAYGLSDSLSCDKIVENLDARFTDIIDAVDDDIRNDYLLYRSFALKGSGRYEEAISELERSRLSHCDALQVDCNIAFVYYSWAVDGSAKGGDARSQRIDPQKMVRAYTLLDKIVSAEKLKSQPELLKRVVLKIYLSCCAFLGMPHRIEDPEQYITRDIDYDIKRNLIFNTDKAIPSTHIDLLNKEDKLLAKMINCAQDKDDTGVKELVTGLTDEEIGDMSNSVAITLLQLLVIGKELEEYRRIKELMHTDDFQDIIECLDACCLEAEGKLNEAKAIFDKHAAISLDHKLLLNIQRFYDKNKFDESQASLYLRMRDLIKDGIIVIDKLLEFSALAVEFFIARRLPEAEGFIELLGDGEDEGILKLKAYHYREENNIPKLYECSVKLFELTDDPGYALNAVYCLRLMLRYDEALELCFRIYPDKLGTDKAAKIQALKFISDLYVLKGQNDESFHRATEANELCKENPYDDTHYWYFARGVRTGHMEVLGKSIEYKNEHPVVVDWISAFSIDKNDPLTSITKGIESFTGKPMDGDGVRHDREIKQYYKRGFITNDMMLRHSDFDLNAFAGAVGNRFAVFCGVIKQLEKEKRRIGDDIFADFLALLILASANSLEALKDVKNVHLTYDTVNVIQTHFLTYPNCARVEKILEWIYSGKGIVFEKRGINKLPGELLSNLFSDEALSCMYASIRSNIPMLSCETLLGRIKDLEEASSLKGLQPVSLPALCFSRVAKNPMQNQYIYNLLKQCEFVTFDARTICYQVEKNGMKIDEKQIEPFLNCTSNADMISFANVYIAAVEAIDKTAPDAAIELACLFVDNAKKIWKRGSHYRDWQSESDDFSIRSEAITRYCVHLKKGLAFLYSSKMPEKLALKISELECLMK